MADDRDDTEPQIGLGYPQARLARALRSDGVHAPARATAWLAVLRGMIDGTLDVGSRLPVAGTPGWVTLEVLHGGFASGRFAAGGELEADERRRADALGAPKGQERLFVNESFLTEAHVGELDAWLDDARYRIRTPEEAALLTAVWLARRGEVRAATDLLATVRPWFDRLRFHPRPATRPMPDDERVQVESVAAVRERLEAAKANPRVVVMNQAISVYGSLVDRVVSLWLETVEGEVPDMERDESGQLIRDARGQPVSRGGFPGARFPKDFADRARAIVADHAAASRRHRGSGKPDRRGEIYFELRTALTRWLAAPVPLSPAEAARVRRGLSAFVAAHGAPGSERHRRMRAAQAETAARPLHATVAHAVARRLSVFDGDDVPLTSDELLQALTDDRGAPIASVPASIRRRLERCVAEPVETLIADGRIRSAEALALVVPTLTSRALVLGIEDDALRRLVRANYVAFRRRRSLLLVNLESQIRFEELPWAEAVRPWAGAGRDARGHARETLRRLVTLSLCTFPATILPNRLMKEVRSLARQAELVLPLVDEIAADIFMGTFRDTFLQAARASMKRLEGTLYARFYALPVDRLLAIDDAIEDRFGVATSPAFDALCAELAGVPGSSRYDVAANGAVLEWAQILTTHNVVPLLEALGLVASLPLDCMAEDAFRAALRLVSLPAPRPYVARVRRKNTAYALRQALCFASLAGAGPEAAFVALARAQLAEAGPHAGEVLGPAIARLVALHASETPAGLAARPFTGWMVRTG